MTTTSAAGTRPVRTSGVNAETTPAQAESAATARYLNTLKDALDDEGLLGFKSEGRGKLTLNGRDTDRLLEVPEVKRDVSRFTREVVLGQGGFQVSSDDAGMEKLAVALGKAGDAETFGLLKDAALAPYRDNHLLTLTYESKLSDAFALGQSGTKATSGRSGFSDAAQWGAEGGVAWAHVADAQWQPAIERASDYARKLGFDGGVTFAGTRNPSYGEEPGHVNTAMYQAVFVHQGDQTIKIGEVLPEMTQAKLLKSSDQLFGDFKRLIDDSVLRTERAAEAAKAAGAGNVVNWF